jgi:hypothetical protein
MQKSISSRSSAGPAAAPITGSTDRLHLLTEVGIRHAEHRRVADLGMRHQQVLGFLRIDVHTARNDHEARTVGEIQEAVAVDVADVADGAHAAVGRACGRRALGVVEVLERGGGLEPDLARCAGRHFAHRFVQDVQLAEQHLAHGAGVRQPLALSQAVKPRPSVAP